MRARWHSADGHSAFIPHPIPLAIGIPVPRQKKAVSLCGRGVDSIKVAFAGTSNAKSRAEAYPGAGFGKLVAATGSSPRVTSVLPPICAIIAPQGAPNAQAFSVARLAEGEALSVRGQLRLLTVDVSDRSPLMDVDGTNVTVILLRDASGSMVPYRIDEVFSLVDARDGSVSDYTALVRMDGSDTEPVIVRALDAEIPSFVGIEDADELERVSSEYQALVNRRNLRLI